MRKIPNLHLFPGGSRRLDLVALILLALLGLPGRASGQTANEPALPYAPSLDLSSMDKSIDPCVNFYEYACGGWRKKNPIPADQTSWSVYGKLYQDNLNFLRRILEQAASNTNQRDPATQKIGDFYASCIDEAGIEKSGLDPIKPELEAIARLNSVSELAPVLARLQMATGGYRSILFRGGSDQDPDDSEQIIASLDQGGLGLPDRDYYTKEDAKSKETRERYVQHVQKKFELLANWKTYLRFHVADSSAQYLSANFVQENFEFYRKYLRGAKEKEPQWKRCVQFTDYMLGEALGQAYVRKVFSPELKQSTLDMVRRIEDAMAKRIQQLDWMSPETKQQALEKLQGIRNKIGYPDRWRDYGPVKIARAEFLGNVQRATEFENRRQIAKIGRPVDRGEWLISPATVDAYYNPQMNDINFPAGVLQPPLYDAKLDDAPNYGDTGGTIGHELTHGFDDEGSQFDAKGNLKNWWKEEDRKKFDERTKCVSDQYSQYVMVDEVHINGELTKGEDVADLGGEILAYMAWGTATAGKNLQPADGLTPEQRFFIGFAQWACANERPEDLRVRAQTDPHSPPEYRVNGVVVNMPEFAKAFSCG